MKRSSEAQLGEALRSMDFDLAPYVYRLPDPKTGAGVSNWKPCDFMVWWRQSTDAYPGRPIVAAAWVEAKDTDALNFWPRSELRPSQAQGIRDAGRLGIPYLLAIYWRRHRGWTISDGIGVLDYLESNPEATSIAREKLLSRFGVDAKSANLGQTIRVILEDGW